VFLPDAALMRRLLGGDCPGCGDLSPPYSFGYRYGAGQPVILAVVTSHPLLRLS
jgi:hypothetical protein